MTTATLHPAEREYQREIDRLLVEREAVMARRDQAVRNELAKPGATTRSVAAEFALSHQRVAQIAAQG